MRLKTVVLLDRISLSSVSNKLATECILFFHHFSKGLGTTASKTYTRQDIIQLKNKLFTTFCWTT